MGNKATILCLPVINGSAKPAEMTLLFPLPKGDPACSIYLGPKGVIAGSMMGRVFVHLFDGRKSICLAAWSEDAVRGVFMSDDRAWATVGESHATSWDLTNPKLIRVVRFEKPLSDGSKFVLQRGASACVVSRTNLWKVDVAAEVSDALNYHLPEEGEDDEVDAAAPTDFNGTHLAVAHWNKSTCKVHIHNITNANCPVTAIIMLPVSSPMVSQIKLWAPGRLVTVFNQRTIHVWDLTNGALIEDWRGHRGDIVAVDGSSPERLRSLGRDNMICTWEMGNGCKDRINLSGVSFTLGFPYFMTSSTEVPGVVITTDEGVILVSPC